MAALRAVAAPFIERTYDRIAAFAVLASYQPRTISSQLRRLKASGAAEDAALSALFDSLDLFQPTNERKMRTIPETWITILRKILATPAAEPLLRFLLGEGRAMLCFSEAAVRKTLYYTF